MLTASAIKLRFDLMTQQQAMIAEMRAITKRVKSSDPEEVMELLAEYKELSVEFAELGKTLRALVSKRPEIFAN